MSAPVGASRSAEAFAFFGLAFGLAAMIGLAAPYIGEASALLTMLTPLVAVFIMSIRNPLTGGFRAALAELGVSKAGVRLWPLAAIAPMLIFAGGLAILVLAGQTRLMMPDVPLGQLAANLLAGLVIGCLLAFCEEIGWRGYMLPRMSGYGLIPGMLIVGFLHGSWHLPLLLTTDYYHPDGNPWIIVPMFMTTLTLAGVFYGYLRVRSGSIWPVAVAHAAVNASWNLSERLSQTRSPLVLEYIGGESGLVMIVGLMAVNLLLIALIRRTARQRPQGVAGHVHTEV
jgi:uncharacterized protein